VTVLTIITSHGGRVISAARLSLRDRVLIVPGTSVVLVNPARSGARRAAASHWHLELPKILARRSGARGKPPDSSPLLMFCPLAPALPVRPARQRRTSRGRRGMRAGSFDGKLTVDR